jgi:hypothetical protein
MTAWAQLVYILCFLTSALCAGLLVRGYTRSRSRILLWSAACFVLLAMNNLLAVVDLVLLPTQVDLSAARIGSSLAGVLVLLYGFIWETD